MKTSEGVGGKGKVGQKRRKGTERTYRKKKRERKKSRVNARLSFSSARSNYRKRKHRLIIDSALLEKAKFLLLLLLVLPRMVCKVELALLSCHIQSGRGVRTPGEPFVLPIVITLPPFPSYISMYLLVGIYLPLWLDKQSSRKKKEEFFIAACVCLSLCLSRFTGDGNLPSLTWTHRQGEERREEEACIGDASLSFSLSPCRGVQTSRWSYKKEWGASSLLVFFLLLPHYGFQPKQDLEFFQRTILFSSVSSLSSERTNVTPPRGRLVLLLLSLAPLSPCELRLLCTMTMMMTRTWPFSRSFSFFLNILFCRPPQDCVFSNATKKKLPEDGVVYACLSSFLPREQSTLRNSSFSADVSRTTDSSVWLSL